MTLLTTYGTHLATALARRSKIIPGPGELCATYGLSMSEAHRIIAAEQRRRPR